MSACTCHGYHEDMGGGYAAWTLEPNPACPEHFPKGETMTDSSNVEQSAAGSSETPSNLTAPLDLYRVLGWIDGGILMDADSARQITTRAVTAEATIARVRALCMNTDGEYLGPEDECNNAGSILQALYGAE